MNHKELNQNYNECKKQAEHDMTLQDRQEYFEHNKKQLKCILDTALNKPEADCNQLSWYCSLRNTQHDHEFDGVRGLKIDDKNVE